MLRLILPSLLVIGPLCGCASLGLPDLSDQIPGPTDLPFIHRIDVQQGNVITQEMLSQLQPGMDRKKVQFVMGTPIIQDTFNADRWDYVFTTKPGRGDTERRLITLVFVDEKLHHAEGNVKAAAGVLVADLHQDTTIDVPRFRKPSFVTRVKSSLPFADDMQIDETESEPDRKADTEGVTEGLQAPEEPLFKVTPYDNIQAAPGEGVVVPPDAPTLTKKKGFFGTLADSVGIGPEEGKNEDETKDPGDPRYRDIKDPNQR